MAPIRCRFDQTAVWHSDAARGPSTPSLDHLVGAGKQSGRHSKAERLCSLELRKVWPRRTLQEWLAPVVPRAADYGFGGVRVATLGLLIFSAPLGWRSFRIVWPKISDEAVSLRSSPPVFADTPVPTSASTCILAGKPPRAMSSAAMLLHLYRGIGSSQIARLLNSQPLKAILSRDMRR